MQREQGIVETSHPDIVLRRDRPRFTKAEFPALQDTGVSCPRLGLVGHHDHRNSGPPHDLGDRTIGRQNTGPRIDQKESRIGFA